MLSTLLIALLNYHNPSIFNDWKLRLSIIALELNHTSSSAVDWALKIDVISEKGLAHLSDKERELIATICGKLLKTDMHRKAKLILCHVINRTRPHAWNAISGACFFFHEILINKVFDKGIINPRSGVHPKDAVFILIILIINDEIQALQRYLR
ncbi:hypothetical protein [Tuwongella immobilis]|nr:hypothetical protein [Tuwongella immobilis]